MEIIVDAVRLDALPPIDLSFGEHSLCIQGTQVVDEFSGTFLDNYWLYYSFILEISFLTADEVPDALARLDWHLWG
jgi:hypothetical protein